jgi:hypothetical protein
MVDSPRDYGPADLAQVRGLAQSARDGPPRPRRRLKDVVMADEVAALCNRPIYHPVGDPCGGSALDCSPS